MTTWPSLTMVLSSLRVSMLCEKSHETNRAGPTTSPGSSSRAPAARSKNQTSSAWRCSAVNAARADSAEARLSNTPNNLWLRGTKKRAARLPVLLLLPLDDIVLPSQAPLAWRYSYALAAQRSALAHGTIQNDQLVLAPSHHVTASRARERPGEAALSSLRRARCRVWRACRSDAARPPVPAAQ